MRFVNPIPFVLDVGRSREVYWDRLGLRVLDDFENFVLFEEGFAVHEGRSLERTIWRTEHPAAEPYGRNNLLFYFEHDDVDAAFESITSHVEMIHPVEQQAWGQRVFRFYNPDGDVVEVGEPQSTQLSGDPRTS